MLPGNLLEFSRISKKVPLPLSRVHGKLLYLTVYGNLVANWFCFSSELLWPSGWLLHVNCFRPMEYEQFDLCHMQAGALKVLAWYGLVFCSCPLLWGQYIPGRAKPISLVPEEDDEWRRINLVSQPELSTAAADPQTHEQEIKVCHKSLRFCSCLYLSTPREY